MPKGVSINQQCGKLKPLLFESHGVAETNFFPPTVSRVMLPYGQIHVLSPCILNCCIFEVVSSYDNLIIQQFNILNCCIMRLS